VLAGLFGLAGVAAAEFPAQVLTPAVAALVVGVVVACVSQGALGVLLGPLDLLGALGNVLSYLRLAAVGLASTYLAEVANQLGARGPLLLGVLVATLFHALNLALAAFSPTIQALRLHYVEFFGQFYEGGGRLFAPLGGSVAPGPENLTALPVPATTSPEPVPAVQH
jgi:V/A-type H+-transporting ATPase subunit I